MTSPAITINLGDRVRIAREPLAPVLTVATLYLQGNPEERWASCTWLKGAQRVDVRLSELAPEGVVHA